MAGTGLLSVMGISFTFLPIAQSSIQNMRACSCGGVTCTVGGTCNTCAVPLEGDCNTGQEAYGRFLGTVSTGGCQIDGAGYSGIHAILKFSRRLLGVYASGVRSWLLLCLPAWLS